MKIGIMQPYFFPYLAYWQLINIVDLYVVYDDVTYIKGGWINRNNILLEGNRHLIMLPLEKASSFKKINEIYITKDAIAIKKIIKMLESAYGKAPYFDIIMPMIRRLIVNNATISGLNYCALIEINKYLGINTKILLSSEIDKNNDLKGQDKVIHINKLLGGDTYINAIGGLTLYNRDLFKENSLDIHFLQMEDTPYLQYKNEFISKLSIIDILMFNSKYEAMELLKKYTII